MYTYSNRGLQVTSSLYVTGYKCHLIKLRFTYAQQRGMAAERVRRALLKSVLALLR